MAKRRTPYNAIRDITDKIRENEPHIPADPGPESPEPGTEESHNPGPDPTGTNEPERDPDEEKSTDPDPDPAETREEENE